MEGERNCAVCVGLVAQRHAYGSEDSETQEVGSCLFDLGGAVLVPGPHEKPSTDPRLAHPLQSPEPDLPDADGCARRDVKLDIEHAVVGVFVRHRDVHLRERVAAILQRCLQALATGEDLGRDRRVAFLQA